MKPVFFFVRDNSVNDDVSIQDSSYREVVVFMFISKPRNRIWDELITRLGFRKGYLFSP